MALTNQAKHCTFLLTTKKAKPDIFKLVNKPKPAQKNEGANLDNLKLR